MARGNDKKRANAPRKSWKAIQRRLAVVTSADRLAAADYPEFIDLVVKLEKSSLARERWVRLESHSAGRLASFPWMAGEQLPGLGEIPGAPGQRYSDCDQGYTIEIFEADGWVFVLSSPDAGAPFDTYFRVPAAAWILAWKSADRT